MKTRRRGSVPIGGLAVDEAGNVYGTTSYGKKVTTSIRAVGRCSRCPSLAFAYIRYFNPDRAEGCWPRHNSDLQQRLAMGNNREVEVQRARAQSSPWIHLEARFISIHSQESRKRVPSSAFSLWGYGTTCFGGGKARVTSTGSILLRDSSASSASK